MYVTPEYQRTVYTALKKYFPATKEADLHPEYAINLFPEITDPSTIIRQLIAPALKKHHLHHAQLVEQETPKEDSDTVQNFLHTFIRIIYNTREKFNPFGESKVFQTEQSYPEDRKALYQALTTTTKGYSGEYSVLLSVLTNSLHQIPHSDRTAGEDNQYYSAIRTRKLDELLQLITGLIDKAAYLPDN